MYPHERSLVKNLAGKKFVLIGVNSDPEITTAQGLVKTGAVTWRSFWNGKQGPGGPIAREWGVQSWPTIYLIDAEGKIRYQNVRGPKLNEAIATLLEEVGEDFPEEAIEAAVEEETARTFPDPDEAAAEEPNPDEADDDKAEESADDKGDDEAGDAEATDEKSGDPDKDDG
jgi:hypothetical protein